MLSLVGSLVASVSSLLPQLTALVWIFRLEPSAELARQGFIPCQGSLRIFQLF